MMLHKVVIGIFFLFSSEVHANAIVPLMNIFNKETMVPASILTVFIILIEAYILNRWINKIAFKIHLKNAFINNIASSMLGSLIVIFLFDKQPIYELISFYPFMFLLTLAVETPLLKHEYGDYIKFKTWKLSTIRSFSLHLLSYMFVFLSQPVLFILLGLYLNFAQTQIIDNWEDTTILQNEVGYIYSIKKESTENNKLGKRFLYQYDVKRQLNKKLSLDLKMDDHILSWDIRENIIAYNGMGNYVYIQKVDTNEILNPLKNPKNPLEFK